MTGIIHKKGERGSIMDPLSLFLKFLAETYSPVCTPHSTIGADGLNFRVRHGTGCDTAAISTKK